MWIRGEANILADAPSRAPWEAELARNLPIPDLPLRELIKQMFVSPEAWEKMVGEKKTKMNLDEWQALEAATPAQVNDATQDMGFKQVTEVQKTAEGGGTENFKFFFIVSHFSSGHRRVHTRVWRPDPSVWRWH